MVAFLVAVDGVDSNLPTPHGDPPVIEAAIYRQLACMQALLEHEGVDVDRPNERGEALVIVLIRIRRREFWHALVTSPKKPDLLQRNREGKTPKQVAIDVGWPDVASRLPEG
jgi:ankyrin repeat protein